MMGGIERWIQYAIVPGSFLQAIIKNDLSDAVGQADDENLKNLPAYVGYFYNEAPSQCWGSVDKFEEWQGSMDGIAKRKMTMVLRAYRDREE